MDIISALCKKIGADSLEYLTCAQLRDAIGLPRQSSAQPALTEAILKMRITLIFWRSDQNPLRSAGSSGGKITERVKRKTMHIKILEVLEMELNKKISYI